MQNKLGRDDAMAVIPVLLVQFVVVFGNVISGGLLAGNNTSELKNLLSAHEQDVKLSHLNGARFSSKEVLENYSGSTADTVSSEQVSKSFISRSSPPSTPKSSSTAEVLTLSPATALTSASTPTPVETKLTPLPTISGVAPKLTVPRSTPTTETAPSVPTPTEIATIPTSLSAPTSPLRITREPLPGPSVKNASLSSSTTAITSPCGEGFVFWGDRCYIFLTEAGRFALWNIDTVCSYHGGLVPSVPLHDPHKWAKFRGLLLHLRSVIMLQNIRYYRIRDVSFIMGLKSARILRTLPPVYHYSWVWPDGTVAHNIYRQIPATFSDGCAALLIDYIFNSESAPTDYLMITSCTTEKRRRAVLCEIGDDDFPSLSGQADNSTKIQIHRVESTASLKERFVRCPILHFTHKFLACDVSSACWARGELGSSEQCDYSVTPLPPSFTCTSQIERVPFALVCNYRVDCGDGSDEDFCKYIPCQPNREFQCNNQQCVLLEHRCDRIFHCLDLSDELLCDNLRSGYSDIPFRKSVKLTYFVGQRMFVSIDDLGTLAPQTVSDDFPCPLTHFWCSDDTYCLPVFLRCNSIYDCPNHEDEAGCDTYTCPGHYRCRGSNVCVNPIHLCDGVFHCPQKDDELMCGFNCTHSCACYGTAFFCRDVFPAGEFPELRFLDGIDSGLTPADLVNNTLLVHLSLARCGLTRLSHMTHQNLLFFDLSDNKLRKITLDHIVGVEQLRELVLSGNPLASTFVAITGNFSLSSLLVLDLSRVIIKTIDVEVLRGFPNIETLNISKSGVDVVLVMGFQPLTQLRMLDARGCPMTQFPRDIFLGLEHLQSVRGDNYKLCCPATLPVGFNVANCQAPEDEISSCETLLRSETYRIFLSLFAASSLLGNAGSLVYRVLVSKNVGKTTFGIFVVHLCVADFLMGVYLTVIGVADRLFIGTYLWNGLTWTRSPGCRTAGFLSLLSSEVSVSFIGLITLDRFIVIRCPFTTRRFRPWSAHVASGAVWLFGTVLAAVPLLPVTAHWNFYGQTGICIPLPITRRVFPGQKYSFGVMIIFNLLLFLLIGSGQGLIYKSILGSRMGLSDTNNASQDLVIARRLFAVVVSDFLCWFPIGLLGLLASNGVPIPGEVTVAIAIFVLPVNSALNPLLYTLNILLEKRRRLKEDRLQQRLVAELRDKDLLD